MDARFSRHMAQMQFLLLLDLLTILVQSRESWCKIVADAQWALLGLGLLGGLGGDFIRDVMMQEGGVYMLNSPTPFRRRC